MWWIDWYNAYGDPEDGAIADMWRRAFVTGCYNRTRQ